MKVLKNLKKLGITRLQFMFLQEILNSTNVHSRFYN